MAQQVIYFIKKDVMTKLVSFAIFNMNMSLMTFKSDTDHKAGTIIKDGVPTSKMVRTLDFVQVFTYLKMCTDFKAGT